MNSIDSYSKGSEIPREQSIIESELEAAKEYSLAELISRYESKEKEFGIPLLAQDCVKLGKLFKESLHDLEKASHGSQPIEAFTRAVVLILGRSVNNFLPQKPENTIPGGTQ
jgi:hypothetical protein